MSDADFIEALGGSTAVGRTLGLERRVVFNWKTRGIPDHAIPGTARMAAERGVELPPRIATRLLELQAHYGSSAAAE